MSTWGRRILIAAGLLIAQGAGASTEFPVNTYTTLEPDTGDTGGLVLQIGNGGGTYCVSFGGAAGGTETRDTAQRWTVVDATAEPGCPSP